MLSTIMTFLLQGATGVYDIFRTVLTACGEDFWSLIYAMIVVMLVTRFLIYPFLKGRVISNFSNGEEMGGSRSTRSSDRIQISVSSSAGDQKLLNG